jgi:hypothetical protein
MGGGDHDRARSLHGVAKSIQETAGRRILDRQHRRAVGQEESG